MKKIGLLLLCTLLFISAQSQLSIDGNEVTLKIDPKTQDKNILRFHYWRASINGDASISYERVLGKRLSLEIGAGLTYRTYVDPIYFLVFDFDYPDMFFYKFKFNYSYNAGVRLYLKKDFMEGLYLNPFYRQVNYKLVNDGTGTVDSYKFMFNDLNLSIGYNHILGKAFLDYFGGIGVRHAHSSAKYPNDDTPRTEGRFLPLLLMGMRIGFTF